MTTYSFYISYIIFYDLKELVRLGTKQLPTEQGHQNALLI